MGFFKKIRDKILKSVVTKVAAGAAIVAMLGGGTVGLAYAGGLTGAKTAVGVALINTFVTDAGKLFTDVKEQGGELLLEVSGQEFSLDALGMGSMVFPDATFRLLAKSNAEQEISAGLDLLVAGNTLLTANVYANEELWQVSVPKLFSPVLTANYNAKDIVSKLLEGEIPTELSDKVRRGYEEYLAGIEIKQGRREEIDINGVRYNCRIYRAEIPAETVNFLAAEVAEEFDAYGIALKPVPVVADKVTFTFYVCKERIVSITAKWSTQANKNGETVVYQDSLKMNILQNGEFSLNVALEGREWNVKGALTAVANEINPLAGTRLDVGAMTAKEEADLRAEVSKNITRLIFRWMGLLR